MQRSCRTSERSVFVRKNRLPRWAPDRRRLLQPLNVMKTSSRIRPGALRWLGVVSLLAASGCGHMAGRVVHSEFVTDRVLRSQDRRLALQAWREASAQLGPQPHPREFRDGFIDGFIDRANGATGCAPDTPPPKYYSWRYLTPHGAMAVQSWFAGYPYGVAAAERCGVADARVAQVSPRLRNMVHELQAVQSEVVVPSGEAYPIQELGPAEPPSFIGPTIPHGTHSLPGPQHALPAAPPAAVPTPQGDGPHLLPPIDEFSAPQPLDVSGQPYLERLAPIH